MMVQGGWRAESVCLTQAFALSNIVIRVLRVEEERGEEREVHERIWRARHNGGGTASHTHTRKAAIVCESRRWHDEQSTVPTAVVCALPRSVPTWSVAAWPRKSK